MAGWLDAVGIKRAAQSTNSMEVRIRSGMSRCSSSECSSLGASSPTSVCSVDEEDLPTFLLSNLAVAHPETPIRRPRVIRPPPVEPRRPTLTTRMTFQQRLRECPTQTIVTALDATGVSTDGSSSERLRRLTWCFKLYEPRDVMERWSVETLRVVAGMAEADKASCIGSLLGQFFSLD